MATNRGNDEDSFDSSSGEITSVSEYSSCSDSSSRRSMDDRHNDDEGDVSGAEGSYAADGDGVGDGDHGDDDADSHNSDGVDDGDGDGGDDDDDVDDDSESVSHDACHDASDDASDDDSGEMGSTTRDEAPDHNSPLVSPKGSEEEEEEASETHNEVDSSDEVIGSLSPERESNDGKDAVQEQGNDLPDTATQREEEKEKDDAENYSDCEDDPEEADTPADDSDEHEAPTTENLQDTPLPGENDASDNTTERPCNSGGIDNIESGKNLPNDDGGIESAVVVTERPCDRRGVDNIESGKNLPKDDGIESAVVVNGSDSPVLDSPTVGVVTRSHDAEDPNVIFQRNDSDIEKGTSTTDTENHGTRPTDNSSLNVEKGVVKSDTSASMEPRRLWTRWIPFGLAFVALVISVIGISVAFRNQDNKSSGTESPNSGIFNGNEILTEPDRSKCRTLKNVTFDSDAFGNPYPLAISLDTFASAGFATLSSESDSAYVLRTASRLTGQPIGNCKDPNSDAYHEIIPVLAANDYDCKERFGSDGTLAFWFQQDTVRILQIGLLRWRESFFHIPPVEVTVTPATGEPAMQMFLPQVNDLPVYDPRTPWYETLTIDHQQTGVLRVHGQVAVTFIEFCEEDDF